MNKKRAFNAKFSDITMERALLMLKYLEKSLKERDNYVIYARGHTYRSKNKIKSIEKKFPVQVIINKIFRKGLLFLIPLPMPERIFLIKILDPQCLRSLFNELDDYLLIDYALFNQETENDFLQEICVDKTLFEVESIKNDDRHLIYTIDTDNPESDTGIMEVVSYGKNTPKELINFL